MVTLLKDILPDYDPVNTGNKKYISEKHVILHRYKITLEKYPCPLSFQGQ